MIIRINKTNFAVNGDWQQLLANQTPLDVVKTTKKRFYSVIDGGSISLKYLVTYRIVQAPSKLYSLASMIGSLTDPKHSDFIFIHELDGKLYYLAYREGLVDIKTDKALSTSDAKKQIRNYVEQWGIEHLYYFGHLSSADDFIVPNQHQLDSSKLKSIDRSFLVSDAAKSTINIKNLILSCFIIAVLGYILWDLTEEYFNKIPVVREVTNEGPTEEEIKAEKARIIRDKLETIYSAPYSTDVLELCSEYLDLLPMKQGFWERSSYVCGQSQFSYLFNRNQFGEIPSEFKTALEQNERVTDVSLEFKMPLTVKADVDVEFKMRSFIPQSIEEIEQDANRYILDVLARFSDVETINSLSPAKTIAMTYYELKGTPIIFADNELFKQGSFVLRSRSLNRIVNADQLFDSDFVFLTNVTKKGDFYDAKYTFITL